MMMERSGSRYLQTSQKDVYAIGDAIQSLFRPTNEKLRFSVNNAIRTTQDVQQDN